MAIAKISGLQTALNNKQATITSGSLDMSAVSGLSGALNSKQQSLTNQVSATVNKLTATSITLNAADLTDTLKARVSILEANVFPHYAFKATSTTLINRLYFANSTNRTDRIIQFGVRAFDYGYFYDPTISSYVIPTDGIYSFTVYLNIVSPVSGTIKNNIFIERELLNGDIEVIGANSGSVPINNFVACMASLTVGDKICCSINSTTANSAVTVSQAGLISYFSGFLYCPVSLTATAPPF